jgi:hypothetical protein
MTFGNGTCNSTTGIDSASIIPPYFAESETPPPPFGFEAIWAPVRPHQFGVGVRGLLDLQLNEWTTCTQIDTFRILIAGDDPSSTISFKWPDRCTLYYVCDSIFLIDPTNHIPRIDMFSQDSLSIPFAGDSGISNLYIYKYGAYPCCIDCERTCPFTSAPDDQLAIPVRFSLYQNYPNPFNPVTTLEFTLPTESSLRLTICDLLGRELAVLADEKRRAGNHRISFDGSELSNGIYFARLQTSIATLSKAMILLK